MAFLFNHRNYCNVINMYSLWSQVFFPHRIASDGSVYYVATITVCLKYQCGFRFRKHYMTGNTVLFTEGLDFTVELLHVLYWAITLPAFNETLPSATKLNTSTWVSLVFTDYGFDFANQYWILGFVHYHLGPVKHPHPYTPTHQPTKMCKWSTKHNKIKQSMNILLWLIYVEKNDSPFSEPVFEIFRTHKNS